VGAFLMIHENIIPKLSDALPPNTLVMCAANREDLKKKPGPFKQSNERS